MSVTCDVCEKTFSTRSNLNKHTKRVHNSQPKTVSYGQNVWSYKCLENECDSSYRENSELINHLRQKHNFQFDEEYLEFPDLTSFQVWKTSIEEQHKCRYVVSSTFRSTKGLNTYYKCNRSGMVRSKIRTKRLLKPQGSCKLNRACTSQVHLLECNLESKTICVKWIKTHYGHAIELQHLRILKKDKAAVATKLLNGESCSRILDEYRDRLSHDINRVDLITRKDIRNIKKSYNIPNITTDEVKHKNDFMPVDVWVKECESDPQNNPILFYKCRGVMDSQFNLSDSDYCLIIMTNFQKTMLKKFGGNIIVIDGMHGGLNNYDFELTSVMVVDEFGEGIPVAFMFTNRKNIYELFFRIIRSQISPITTTTTTFITNVDSPSFSNAWNNTMQPASYQLFYPWHVDCAWQKNLSKITDKEKRSNVYKTLKVLQQDTEDEHNFKERLVNFIKQLVSDEDTFRFGVYFEKEYSFNFCQWAYCFSKQCGINTNNMRFESMTEVIKYLNGKKVKCLDKSLHFLLKYVRNKAADRLIKYTKLTKEIIKIHDTVLTSTNTFIVYIDDENVNNEWTVNELETNNEINSSHCVKQISDRTCCDLICEPCAICFHMYTCTCTDFSTNSTICKHIHIIAQTFYKKSRSSENYMNEAEIKVEVTTSNELASKIHETTSKLNTTDLNLLSSDIRQQIYSYLSVIDRLIDSPTSKVEPSVGGGAVVTNFISDNGSNNECRLISDNDHNYTLCPTD